MMPISAETTGDEELIAKLGQVDTDLSGPPMVEAMKKATTLVAGSAKRFAPVDRGTLRASITPAVLSRGKMIDGVVSSNLKYAPAQELGTRPFWPPFQEIYDWVRRKRIATGSSIWAVAVGVQRAIARRGIKKKLYLQRALDDNRERIVKIISDAVNGVVDK